MTMISFIKILFIEPLLIYKGCVEPTGSECINNGWTNGNYVTECQGINYIGAFTGGHRITKTFWSPSQKLMKLSFTLAKFDSWDYESVFIYKDGQEIDRITHGPFEGINVCQNLYPDLLDYRSYFYQLPQGQNYITFSLVDNLQADDIESWGIRDIKLQLINHCIDFYSECNYQGQLWRVCQGNQTTSIRQIPFKIKSIYILVSGVQVQIKDPQFKGGIKQTYTTDQTCLDDYHFPKYEQPI
ncbi:unnamed protein product (macronuclear) [Paramecium tetraurelia]|uniref:Chromosome undetermined scaffold_153, whole genome shotgun sequence n=1 Tax=Paramecium tetraurelia TaxID=5888 RepID=A0C6Z9_PARTE|nr:uncharacterized protein GSPATT00035695001 [Paramecium tetraurelia]XP_001433968.1 uncharacterized protein GSPATT00035700001 [Paramecium tetraurelia]CAK66566.1 unnamed protein product [Paramecium tetraurelia]CAK66571.1 unnamed protein product [Paramecium tetraurelia]|eukprot:XP_001433963.1 hypothetical protein (macronuclear) [Paramecium tetraurelia strain d4-2]